MASGQKLRGLSGQGLDGKRRRPPAFVYTFPVGSHNWTCPESGLWRFVLWGGGASGNNSSNWGGASGGFYMGCRQLIKGQTVTLSVGAGGIRPAGGNGWDGSATAITLPSGEMCSAGGGRSAGVNLGGISMANRNLDVALVGSAGVTTAVNGNSGGGSNPGIGGAASGSTRPGSGAPGAGSFRGGDGGTSSNAGGRAPGGGGSTDSNLGLPGGDGLALVHLERISA
jgi:hypothetical protein